MIVAWFIIYLLSHGSHPVEFAHQIQQWEDHNVGWTIFILIITL